MGTSQHVAISLFVALATVAATGQNQPSPSQVAPRGPSNTRSARCMVRITVDPVIMPLSAETVSSLIHSPAVELKALREVLSINTMKEFVGPGPQGGLLREPITIRWLNTSPAAISFGARPPRQTENDGEFLRQMEQVYGPGYMQQMKGPTSPGQRDRAKDGQNRGSSVEGNQPGSYQRGNSESDRPGFGNSDTPGADAGGAIGGAAGGMGGMGNRPMGMGGMGGYGMGGMMGYGGVGNMRFYGTSAAPHQDTGVEPSATVELQVLLPDTGPSLAEEFLGKVVVNLRESLRRAYESCADQLRFQRVEAEQRHGDAQEFLKRVFEGDTPASQAIRKQLDREVDLGALNGQTPLKEAVEVLRRSVEPPLNIVVLWTDLRENLSVEPTSPVNIDGLPKVKLGTMLDLLVKGLRAGEARPMWRIRGDVIVIGTAATLTVSAESMRTAELETDVRALAAQRSELTRRIQSLRVELASAEARRAAIRSQIRDIQKEVDERLSRDAVTQELEKLIGIAADRVAVLQKMESTGRASPADVAQANESLTRARIEMAKRREELGKQSGGGQLDEFNKELSRMEIDLAEKVAQEKILTGQLNEVQKGLAQASAFDPEAAQLRMAQEALDITARRMAELQTRIANLPLPLVTVIGAN